MVTDLYKALYFYFTPNNGNIMSSVKILVTIISQHKEIEIFFETHGTQKLKKARGRLKNSVKPISGKIVNTKGA